MYDTSVRQPHWATLAASTARSPSLSWMLGSQASATTPSKHHDSSGAYQENSPRSNVRNQGVTPALGKEEAWGPGSRSSSTDGVPGQSGLPETPSQKKKLINKQGWRDGSAFTAFAKFSSKHPNQAATTAYNSSSLKAPYHMCTFPQTDTHTYT